MGPPPQTPQGPSSSDRASPNTPPRRLVAECPPTPRIPVRDTIFSPAGPSKRSRSSRSSSESSDAAVSADNSTFQSPPNKHAQDPDESFVLDPLIGIPTPAKTPSKKSKHYSAKDIASSTKTLFPALKKKKSSRLDLTDDTQTREPEFEIFTDSSAKVPKLDLSPDNPFVKHPGDVAVPHEVKKRVAGRERERRLGGWAERSDGFVSFHRSRKIFTPFARTDRSSPTPGEAEVGEEPAQAEPSTPQESFKPRLLFPPAPPKATPKPSLSQDDPFNSTPAPPSAKKKGKERRPTFLEDFDSEIEKPPTSQKSKPTFSTPAPASLREITPEEEEMEEVKKRENRSRRPEEKSSFGLDGVQQEESVVELKTSGKKRTSLGFDGADDEGVQNNKSTRPVKRAKKEIVEKKEVKEKVVEKKAVEKKAVEKKGKKAKLPAARSPATTRRVTRSMAKTMGVASG